MLKIKQLIAQNILEGVKGINPAAELTADELAGMLEYPPDDAMGDLALPCFKLAKSLRRAPVMIAQTLADGMSCPCVQSAEALNGYLNIRLDPAFLTSHVLSAVLEKKEKYGAPTVGCGKKVVLDYSSPNVAKPFHIGHLGTTVIGHSLKKMHEFAGYDCYGINYLGDWGTQFGKLIVAYRLWGS
ncbi:MAG: arginine--tRNA ligase, partial [Clostridia bacterium]|nr:arginine--tRNA ligase [Clostridia bacterium]